MNPKSLQLYPIPINCTLHPETEPQEAPVGAYTHQLDPESLRLNPTPTSWTPRASRWTLHPTSGSYTHQTNPKAPSWSSRPSIWTLQPPLGLWSCHLPLLDPQSSCHPPCCHLDPKSPQPDPRDFGRLRAEPIPLSLWGLGTHKAPSSDPTGAAGGKRGHHGDTPGALDPGEGGGSGGEAAIPALPLDSPWLPGSKHRFPCEQRLPPRSR